MRRKDSSVSMPDIQEVRMILSCGTTVLFGWNSSMVFMEIVISLVSSFTCSVFLVVFTNWFDESVICPESQRTSIPKASKILSLLISLKFFYDRSLGWHILLQSQKLFLLQLSWNFFSALFGPLGLRNSNKNSVCLMAEWKFCHRLTSHRFEPFCIQVCLGSRYTMPQSLFRNRFFRILLRFRNLKNFPHLLWFTIKCVCALKLSIDSYQIWHTICLCSRYFIPQWVLRLLIVHFFEYYPNFGLWKIVSSPLNYSKKCVYTKVIEWFLLNLAYEFV